MKFNEGGQPVYLDDLRLLQENDVSALKWLMDTLGSAIVIKESPVVDANSDGSYTVEGGIAWDNGELLQWDDTDFSASEWTDTVWLCVKESDTDTRTFEDGQDRACVTAKTVYLSTDSTGVEKCYNLMLMKTMREVLRDKIGYTEYAWKSVAVEWQNGYTGTVKYQDKPECYRVWIKAKSTSTVELTGSVTLFYVDYTSYRWLSVFVSDREAFVDSENGVHGFHISAFDGIVSANVSLPFDDVACAASLPINIIFEIPK